MSPRVVISASQQQQKQNLHEIVPHSFAFSRRRLFLDYRRWPTLTIHINSLSLPKHTNAHDTIPKIIIFHIFFYSTLTPVQKKNLLSPSLISPKFGENFTQVFKVVQGLERIESAKCWRIWRVLSLITRSVEFGSFFIISGRRVN